MRLDTKDARAQISRRRKSQGMHLAVAVICKFNSNYRHSSISAVSISGIFSILRGLLFYLSFFPFSTTKKPWFTQFSLSAFFFACPHIISLNQGMPLLCSSLFAVRGHSQITMKSFWLFLTTYLPSLTVSTL